MRDSELFCESEKDVEVGAGLAGWRDDDVGFADAPLGVGVGAFFFSPDGGGEDEVGEVAGRRGVEAILHDEKVDTAQRLLEEGVVGERDGGIGGDEPERFDLAGDRGFDDVGVSEAARSGNAVHVDVPEASQVFAIFASYRICDSLEGWK